jgi:hypothetical protein
VSLDLAYRDALRRASVDTANEHALMRLGLLALQKDGVPGSGVITTHDPFTLTPPNIPEARLRYRVDDHAGKELIYAEFILTAGEHYVPADISVSRERFDEGEFAVYIKIPNARVKNHVEKGA